MIKGIPSTSLTETTELEKVLKVFNHFTSLFNVGFTLLLGAITIYVLEKSKKEKYGFLNITILIMLSIYISETFGFDGGFYSYFLILMFYYIPIKNKVKQIMVMSILNIIYVLYMSMHVKGNFFELVSLYSVQLYSILALPIIYFLNTDKKNKRVESVYVKLLKYSIYPVHMLIIFWIRLMFFTI